jgi:hypothetical protein
MQYMVLILMKTLLLKELFTFQEEKFFKDKILINA